MDIARKEIDDSLKLSKYCMGYIGLSFDRSKSSAQYLRQTVTVMLSVCTICYHVFSEIVHIGLTLSNSPRVEDVVPLFHTFGYGVLSIAKVAVLWYKKDVFSKLIKELAGIWPIPPLDEESLNIKNKSLGSLRIAHQSYFLINISGVWFYNLTPIAIYFYQLFWLEQSDAKIGFVWVSRYPFDKNETIAHIFVYIFEIFAGQICVWIMICTDLLFFSMASHICLLLRLLQKRIEILATTTQPDEKYYEETTDIIKLHQRLIRYCNDMEDAFSVSNLVNYVMSSVNICCVVFVIVLLEPIITVSNKLFLLSSLMQIGALCWYGDDILHANADIAKSVYTSGWYRTSPKCRRALMFLLIRSQKPIGFTAMKFTNMSLVTYSSILTRSYSYFALLYTMYNEN